MWHVVCSQPEGFPRDAEFLQASEQYFATALILALAGRVFAFLASHGVSFLFTSHACAIILMCSPMHGIGV